MISFLNLKVSQQKRKLKIKIMIHLLLQVHYRYLTKGRYISFPMHCLFKCIIQNEGLCIELQLCVKSDQQQKYVVPLTTQILMIPRRSCVLRKDRNWS